MESVDSAPHSNNTHLSKQGRKKGRKEGVRPGMGIPALDQALGEKYTVSS